MVTFNVNSLDFVDNEEARFGADSDFATRFDSANSRLELEDLTAGAVGYIPQDISTDLVGGKFAETVSEGKALSDNGQVYDSIQAAVDNASSWVKVGPGDFRESVTVGTAGLTLEGSGERTVIDADTLGIGVKVTADDVSISNMTVRNEAGDDVPALSQTSSGGTFNNIDIVNVTVDKSNHYGISIATGTGHIVHNCEVRNAGINNSEFSRGISLPDESIVSNCFVRVPEATDGISVSSDSIIANNTVVDSSTTGRGISASSDSIIIANRVDNTGSTGISDAGSADVIIANNRVSNSGDSNIIGSGTGTVLDGNLET